MVTTQTGWATLDQIAGQIDLPATVMTLHRSMVAGVELAYVIGEIAAGHSGLAAPAGMIAMRAQGEAEVAIEQGEHTSWSAFAASPGPERTSVLFQNAIRISGKPGEGSSPGLDVLIPVRGSEPSGRLDVDRFGVLVSWARPCLRGAEPELPDPTSILRGGGKVVRTVALASPDDLDGPDVGALIEVALGLAALPMDASNVGDLVIKSFQPRSVPAAERRRTYARHRTLALTANWPGHGDVTGFVGVSLSILLAARYSPPGGR